MAIRTMAWLAAALLSVPAHAVEVFQFTFSGPGYHLYNAWECPGTICTTPGFAFDWTGSVEVQTTSRADGSYTGDSLLSLAIASNRIDLTTNGFGGFPGTAPVATIAGGEIVSLQFVYGTLYGGPTYERIALSGLTATYDFGGCHHCGTEHASAVLSPVPEPQTAALMAGGLLLLGWGVRRSSTPPRRG